MTAMDRRRSALLALLLFLACTALAIAVSGTRPHLEQGTAPWVTQLVGYVSALAGGVLLLVAGRNGAAGDRRHGAVVLGALAVLVGVDVLTSGSAGADIGAGLVRVLCLVAVAVVTARVASGALPVRRRP
jgi:peptidoglycan/LPS O-acetylase OafA/YrhL